MKAVVVTHNEVGLACLRALRDNGASIEGIFTRPQIEDLADQSNLTTFAQETGVPLHEVDSVNSDAAVSQIRSYEPSVLFVVGWSRLVEKRVIDVATDATLGMHPAPLPRGRGRAPIAWSLIKGLEQTDLCLFHLEVAADEGDIVDRRSIPIERTDDASSLYQKVVASAGELVADNYDALAAGRVEGTPQNDSDATWWPKRVPDHGIVDWHQSAETVYNWIRGNSHPYPGAYSFVDGREVRLWSAAPPTGERVFAAPGEILGTTGENLVVAAWEERIEIETVGVESRELPAAELLDRYDVSIGDRFANLRDHVERPVP